MRAFLHSLLVGSSTIMIWAAFLYLLYIIDYCRPATRATIIICLLVCVAAWAFTIWSLLREPKR